MIRDFSPRLYQQTILGTAANKNTLVVLPTGLGKTAVAFLLAAQRLHHYPQSKILLLSPTKPLCEQHLQTFQKHLTLPAEKIVLFTGEIPPQKREQLWKTAQIIVSTPQGLENDVINQRIKLEEVSLLIVDEAHHAVKEYSYVWLAKQYDQLAKNPRILALTASPGSDLEKVKEVCKNLFIERVEVRTEEDPDVKPYVQEVKITWLEVEFPEEFKIVQHHLKDCFKSKLLEAQKLGYCSNPNISKGELLGLQSELHQKISSGEKEYELWRSISLVAEALKIEHAMELLESQGIRQVSSYLGRIEEEALTSKTKAVQNLAIDLNFKTALHLAKELVERGIEHPKLAKLQQLVQEKIKDYPDAKMIIFTQFRDSAEEIVQKLKLVDVKNHIFVGQAKKNGLGFSQKQQKEILDRFRAGEFNVLIATAVAEEGLDIPKVDQVIFYEPIPSAIRSIQRRGRTGRLEKGEVIILLTKGTRDQAYRWSSHHKEKSMYRNLDKLKKEFVLQMHTNENTSSLALKEPQKERENENLQLFISKEPVVAILADHREKDNKVVKELINLGIYVKTAQLESADYIVSGKVGVEMKKVPDFVASIIDGRTLEQVRNLKKNFEKSVLIIEGEEDIYTVRNVHPNSIRGMIASIILDFGVPILYTKNPADTAAVLAVMAKREQGHDGSYSFSDHKPHSIPEQLEFIVASIPTVGPQNAKRLLLHFGSLKNLVNASKEELLKIEGIGEKTAERLLRLFEEKYL